MNAKSARNGLIYVIIALVLLHFFVTYITTFIEDAQKQDTTNILGGFQSFIELIKNVNDIATYALVGLSVLLLLLYLSNRSEEQQEKKKALQVQRQ
ncbi:MAG: hypothetical protein HY832_01265 [Candidatus Aenigmarchaeota archaeon]|nr:hypothetical protein [Candidatus Aenigmarchaeota archaeon]